nr:kinase [Luteimonas sp. Y-2-2-4F]
MREGVRVYGLSGLQGTGKSTLAAQLAEAARAHGLRVATLSLDDVYLDRPQREALAREVHPLLATRGPPGTHDLPLALATLDALRAGRPVRLPRFDKLADCRRPEASWPLVEAVDLTILEGWCLGAPAQAPDALAAPLNALERGEDADGRWRRWCNDALARDYPALWARVDRLLFLQPPGFDVVPAWRWQQECALQAAEPARRGMTRAQVERFVQHYERVSRQALRTLPALADAVAPLDAARAPAPDAPRVRRAAPPDARATRPRR